MLNEVTLILIGVVVACAFLVLGVLDLVRPTKRSEARPAGSAGEDESAASDVSERLRTRMMIDPAPPRNRELFPVQVSARVKQPTAAPATRGAVPTVTMRALPFPGRVDEDTETTGTLERCRRMAADGRPGEAVVTAMTVLEQPGAAPPAVASALWREIALARDRMGDRDGALVAYRNAIEAAPDEDRATVRRELVAWVARTVRDSVRSARDTERYAAIVLAREFLVATRATVGAVDALDALRVELDVEFWPAYEAHVHGLVAELDYAAAYRLATEALADAALPGAMRETFEELRTETLAARIDSLVSRSLRAADDGRDWEAAGALERAEALLKKGTTVWAARREEATRRVAAAYSRLGRRRTESGEFEAAIDPLLHALRLDTTDGESRDEACRAMVQALDAVVAARAAAIREIATSGSRESALAQGDSVSTLLRRALAAGVPRESMAQAIATTRQLRNELGAEER